MNNPTPEEYYALFQKDPLGIKIIEHLSSMFYDQQTYVTGDSHETSFNEGKRYVIGFILRRAAASQQSTKGEE